jgi:hypothetical protein
MPAGVCSKNERRSLAAQGSGQPPRGEGGGGGEQQSRRQA